MTSEKHGVESGRGIIFRSLLFQFVRPTALSGRRSQNRPPGGTVRRDVSARSKSISRQFRTYDVRRPDFDAGRAINLGTLTPY